MTHKNSYAPAARRGEITFHPYGKGMAGHPPPADEEGEPLIAGDTAVSRDSREPVAEFDECPGHMCPEPSHVCDTCPLADSRNEA